MHRLADFSLKNRALIALVTIVVAAFGGIAMTLLKLELIPSITFPQLVVVTSYPGASPVIVEKEVSTPIETAIQGVNGLESTTATSQNGLSQITAAFTYGTSLETAEQKVQLAINKSKGIKNNWRMETFRQISINGFAYFSAIEADLAAVLHCLPACRRSELCP